MKKIRVDFSQRTEKDMIPIAQPKQFTSGELVELYDEDLKVSSVVRQWKGRWYFDIDWTTMKVGSWKNTPPKEVQDRVTESPMSIRRNWPTD